MTTDPPDVLPVEGFDEHVPVMTDVECPQCDGGRCDCLGRLVKICARCDEEWPCERVQAYERGKAEATEGWDRQWGGPDGGESLYRLVGPWEPAEKPEPAPKEGEALGVTDEQRADLNKAVSDTWDMLSWPAVKHAMCPLPCYGKPGDRWRCADCGRIWRAIDGPTAIAWERVPADA